jgi:hypothetical protein
VLRDQESALRHLQQQQRQQQWQQVSALLMTRAGTGKESGHGSGQQDNTALGQQQLHMSGGASGAGSLNQTCQGAGVSSCSASLPPLCMSRVPSQAPGVLIHAGVYHPTVRTEVLLPQGHLQRGSQVATKVAQQHALRFNQN